MKIALALFACCVACQSSPRESNPKGGAPVGPQPQVDFVPGDLSTALGTRPELQVVLRGVEVDRATSLLDRALKTGRVRRVDDGTSANVEVQPFRVASDPLAPTARVSPPSELREGWYEFRVPEGMDRVKLSPGAAIRFQDGSWGIRFRVGHGPVISALSMCDAGGSGKPPMIIAQFSEATRLPAGFSVQGTVAVNDSQGRPVHCWEAADQYPQVTMLRLANGDSIARWELFCERMPDALDMSFGAGIEGEDGTKLTELSGTPGTSVRSDASLLAAEGDCRVWRP